MDSGERVVKTLRHGKKDAPAEKDYIPAEKI